MIASGLMTDEVGYRAADRFLAERPTRPTAMVVSSMMMALGAFRAIRAAGLELGRDISMIAHDDVFPFLNRRPHGADDVDDALLDPRRGHADRRARDRDPERPSGRGIHELWPVDLVIRASTGPVRVS